MTSEKDFFNELARTPELPPDLYNNIRHTIRRHVMLMRTMLSLAATVVLAAGVTTLLVSYDRTSGIVSPEVASELQSINDYGNGNDLPKDLESYAFYDGDLLN